MKEKNVDYEVNKLDSRVKWIIIIGAIVLVTMPLAVTQLDWLINFTKTGQIGDTLGGTTAPVIGAVSALLIYFSFRAQINANRIIQKQINEQKTEETKRKNFEYQMERYRHLREHIVDFTFITTRRRITNSGTTSKDILHKGSDAITVFLKSEIQEYFNGNPVDADQHEFSQLRAILSFFSLILNHIKPVKDDEDSKFIFNLIEVLFYRHLWDRIENLSIKILNEPNNPENVLVQILKRIRDIEIELEKYKAIWPN